ncbi:MAG: site-specific integrase [Boseongicola sp. SB0664_bin_43]|uniref:Site-specific integrase n=1 Tax=Boseongicola sp. SB0664_bin_43 TaxID=2604844 RepID=A0A6B0XXR9_9RHOB|nr:site-specific integrase [Boseongicola sp. SB0664_bin_43]MYK30685.1 site-specific integrase [Boseongicola sp. SB0670_bin_30]
MARLRKRTISRRTVASLKADRDTTFWDRDLPGFGVRVHPSGRKVYVVQARGRGEAATRLTLGVHGVLTPEEARRRAALVIARVKAGEDPVPEPLEVRLAVGPTVADLAEMYLEEHVAVRCKPKTEANCRQVIGRYLLPALGRRPALAVTHKEVTELHYGLNGVRSAANQAVAMLSRIYNAAEDRGRLPDGSNPCRLVVKYREHPRDRFLTDAELRRLGRVLDEAETCKGVSAHAVAAIRLLLLTGCRKGEILDFLWEEVDLDAGELQLADSKTGRRTVMLSPEAVAVLARIPRIGGNPHVVPGKVPGMPMYDLNAPWAILRARADLKDVRIHDLRHSYASRALALGESLPMIGRLLGHTNLETSARYAHLAHDSVKDSAVRVSESIAADFLGGSTAESGVSD